ncbi:unnamed protein product [Prunus armeniaca]|uniref:Uncharacterized protein n=1 Tax=Prunus armeniaca TaxID=36596 RepID=A0A6J5Y864_PRUAR|nr:unnamed protein product [Prunus armeniaca]CAB4320603.1 unnamed protein product [Prunus armeniaca]
MLALSNKDVQIVDTTCPWASKVWNTVEKHKKGNCSHCFICWEARWCKMWTRYTSVLYLCSNPPPRLISIV